MAAGWDRVRVSAGDGKFQPYPISSQCLRESEPRNSGFLFQNVRVIMETSKAKLVIDVTFRFKVNS